MTEERIKLLETQAIAKSFECDFHAARIEHLRLEYRLIQDEIAEIKKLLEDKNTEE